MNRNFISSKYLMMTKQKYHGLRFTILTLCFITACSRVGEDVVLIEQGAEMNIEKSSHSNMHYAQQVESKVNSFIYYNPKEAPLSRKQNDSTSDADQPLNGLRAAVKDNIAVADMPLTFGSSLFADNVATRDADIIRRLKSAGAFIVGKTNMDEFAMTVWGTNELVGPTLHPVGLDYSIGGSSTGSAAAVYYDQADFAIGTDTCDSILMPSSQLGLVGYRPSFGLLSTDGILPGYAEHDVVGPITKDVASLQLVMQALTDSDAFRGISENPIEKLAYLSLQENEHSQHSAIKLTYSNIIKHFTDSGINIRSIELNIENELITVENSILHGKSAVDFNHFISSGVNSNPLLLSHLSDPLNMVQITDEPFGPRPYIAEMASQNNNTTTEIQNHLTAMSQLRHVILSAMAAESIDYLMVATIEGFPSRYSKAEIAHAKSHCELSAWTGLPMITIPAGYIDNTAFPFGISILGAYNKDAELIKFARQLESALATFNQ